MLSQSDLHARYCYDPVTGELTFRVTTSRKYVARQRAGGVGSHGYRQLNIDGVRYLEHRVIWAYMTGHWPECFIDHADRDKLNNKWENLRLATRSQNRRNSRAKGYWKRGEKFCSRVIDDGNVKHLGTFDSSTEAHQKFVDYVKAKHQDGFAYVSE